MSIPWVEKYRPTQFDDIVLTRETREIMDGWIEQKRFPNILLHGPPGTGKTTTAWNLIRRYQKEVEGIEETTNIYNDSHNVISLNASDDKGIETMRQRIHVFVQTKPLFRKNTYKFVILDEIDHMTPHAQRMLCFILQEYQDNVRYVLMCNYISHLDKRLRNQVHTLTFYGMTKHHIKTFLMNICKHENINIPKSSSLFARIISKHDCDIRSMINELQQYHSSVSQYKETKQTMHEQFQVFSTSLSSLDTFLKWLRSQPAPKQTLHAILEYSLEFNLLKREWVYQGLNLPWNGATQMTSIVPYQQSHDFTHLVSWYFLNKN